MRVLLYSINYEPEVVGIGKFNGEMARWLAAKGHQVRVVTAYPYYPQWRIIGNYLPWWYRREDLDGVRVYRSPLWVPRRPAAVSRVVHLVSFALSSAPIALWQSVRFQPDLVFVLEPPLVCAPVARLAAWLARSKSWLHVQDLEVDAAFDLGLLRGRWIRRVAACVERWLLRTFDRVSTISDRMRTRLVTKGVTESQCLVFPNWVDTRTIRPLGEPSVLRSMIGIPPDATVALYAGTMGHKQGLNILIDAARRLSGTPIRFVLAGGGPARDGLVEAARELSNVTFIPIQPLGALNDLLNLGDIHLLPQLADAADLVMPSKLGGMLASGRPVIATVHPGTQIAQMIEGCGLVVPPGDSVALASGIQWLHEHSGERRRLGSEARSRAEALWQRDATLAALENSFHACMSEE